MQQAEVTQPSGELYDGSQARGDTTTVLALMDGRYARLTAQHWLAVLADIMQPWVYRELLPCDG